MEKEIWKDISGYEGLYQVSNLGNVFSYAKIGSGGHNGRILKNHKDKDGYSLTMLYKNKIGKWFKIHRLVCIAFLDNPENKKQVNHINGIKDDNRLENLEWCTHSENGLHKYRVLKIKHPMKGKFGKDNITSKKINQYSLDNTFIKTWSSMSDTSRELSINLSCISKCYNNKATIAGNFKWRAY